jgi:hypothetical protein
VQISPPIPILIDASNSKTNVSNLEQRKGNSTRGTALAFLSGGVLGAAVGTWLGFFTNDYKNCLNKNGLLDTRKLLEATSIKAVKGIWSLISSCASSIYTVATAHPCIAGTAAGCALLGAGMYIAHKNYIFPEPTGPNSKI